VSRADDFFPLGAIHQSDGSTRFRVWAPLARQLTLDLTDPRRAEVPMRAAGGGYFEAVVPDLRPGGLYFYRFENGVKRPDPASRFQPQGVHGPSAVTSQTFPWTDADWRGLPWDEYVIYEAHVGAFSAEGTFAGMIAHLDELAELGVTAIQLMPLAQFPGGRNWGYDGVHPYAPQNTYGGPEGLKALVDACHTRSLAVVLDVVYNHLGPEGNYLQEFGPYFTDRYKTPWGPAINYDGRDSDAVREFFIGNATYWLSEFHVDALRLDATDAIYDRSALPFLAELALRVRSAGERLGRRVFAIAENNANDPRITAPAAQGGHALDAQLVDDFQRALHAYLTGERASYYADFGRLEQVAKACRSAFVLTGEHSSYRRQRWGANAAHVPADQFVCFAQNHDTVGNRPGGERLGRLVDFDGLKLAAAMTILSPSVPLLFMGEEYDEPAPFYFFTSYLDAGLAAAVRLGRTRDLKFCGWRGTPPDPQSPETFVRSRPARALAGTGHHRVLREFYRELLRLRREWPAVRQPARQAASVTAFEDEKAIVASRRLADVEICVCLHFGDESSIAVPLPPEKSWQLLLDSADPRWQQSGTRAEISPGTIRLGPKACALVVARD
jgi:maltooligosyltrehalose trehalohydrolase